MECRVQLGAQTCQPLVALGCVNDASAGGAVQGSLEHAAPLIDAAVIRNARAHSIAGNYRLDDHRFKGVDYAGCCASDDVALAELPNVASTPRSNRSVTENSQHMVFACRNSDDIL